MRNVQLRIISFKQTANSEEYLYALNDNSIPQIGGYYYKREYGRFAAIQRVLHPNQLNEKCPVVEATNSPNYELPRIPDNFVENYFKSNKEQKLIQLRLP